MFTAKEKEEKRREKKELSYTYQMRHSLILPDPKESFYFKY
jgi:hypothetical protein